MDLVGNLPGELLNEGSLLALLDQIVAVWEHATHLRCDISGVDMGGADIDCQLDWAAPTANGVPDYSQVVILIRDVADEREAERQMQRQLGQLEALVHMGRGLASSFEIDTILQLLVEVTTELINADASLILLFNTANEELTNLVTPGYSEDELAGFGYAELMDGISGWVVRNRHSALSTDITTDERNTRLAAISAARSPGTSVAVSPIVIDNRVVGTLTATNGLNNQPFTERDLSLVRMLAAQASVAIRNAEMYEELRTAHEELKDTQIQLLQAQKLEAIGSLAAGIAHEINTPIQYVCDNTAFIKDAIGTLAEVASAQWKILEKAASQPDFRKRSPQCRRCGKRKTATSC